MPEQKRMVYEGQLVRAAVDIKVIGNLHVTVDRGSFLKKPENFNLVAGTEGFVKAVESTRILVQFRPRNNGVDLWFDKTILATQLKLLDAMYEG